MYLEIYMQFQNLMDRNRHTYNLLRKNYELLFKGNLSSSMVI